MGNVIRCFTTSEETKRFPIDTDFEFSSPLPALPPGQGFANGTIDLGGLQVYQITSFTKIWSGADDTGVTYFEPNQIPDGFSMLGCYCQSNNTKLMVGLGSRILTQTIFSPSETYLASSTEWYFSNGVLLYQSGDESNPIRVDPSGSNLPQGGSDDETYWLDLPTDETERERVKKGDLQSSQENILEICGGTWVETPSLEFQNGTNNIVAYSSLHGHATYPSPGVVLQGTNVVGLRNDTAKSDMFLDVGTTYSIMAAEYIDSVIEPPWLNYARKWGPKITYTLGVELEKLETSSLGIVESVGESLLEVLPRKSSSRG
ncbi:vacuolar protein sorting-associated protein 62 [Tanacetum coccineum]